MRLSRIKLTGFKSFVDPVELRILPGLTGVVGPNGCGKSNLLEAIRWAMGEGSPKSLRGAAMDDVIFAGTASRPQRQFAEVSILADNDGDEVEVVRRIERGAGSAYRINGRDARARDAQLIFADAATGAHSPALVSQGRIGAVIAAKPAERRQMLEEAAGIAGLHVRRREAEIRLKATEANLTRVAELIAEMEARLTVLRRQARAAERYRKLTDEIRLAEGRLIFARWRDAAAAADAAKAEAETAEGQAATAAEAQRAAAAWVRDAGDRLTTLRQAGQAARDAASDARHRLATAEAERARIEARIADLAAQRERLEADRARESELARDAGDAIARLIDEATALDTRVAGHAAERPALAARADSAERDSRAAELALAQALATQAKADAEHRVASAAADAAAAALARAEAEAGRLHEEMERLPPLGDVQGACAAARDGRETAEERALGAGRALEAAEADRSTAATAFSEAQSALAKLRAASAGLDAEAGALAADADDPGGALDSVTPAPGYEAALAAALADDLSAAIGGDAARRWAGARIEASDPPLSGTPLAAHVTAPPELARRLAQVAVAEADTGQPLAVGQRLVTRSGAMRRWDGFVAAGSGAAAAQRLRRRNRLAAIEQLLPGARDNVANGEAMLAAAAAEQIRLTGALDVARAGRQAADDALRVALRAEDAAAAEAERAERRHQDLATQRTGAAAELDAARAAEAAAQIALAATTGSGIDLAPLEAAAAATREAAAWHRAELLALESGVAADRARLDAARSEAESWRARGGKTGKRVEEMAVRAAALDVEATALEADPALASQAAVALASDAEHSTARAAEAAEAERAGEALVREREASAEAAAEAFAAAREARAGATARADNEELRRVEMGRVSGERFECPPPVLPEKLGFAATDVKMAMDESPRLERATLDRERLGPVNLVAETELAELEATRETSTAEIDELTEATHRLRGSIGSLNREGRQRLRAAFEAVDGHFRTLFSTLFDGGEAHLALIDSDDPLDAGLEIMAQPPGKKLSALTLLSGGEQALTAVALIFALFLTNPAPLCVLDEVDAPLDDANVDRFCTLLDAMARDTDTRFLIVTHNAVTMSRMHRLYGVTMVEQGVSRLVSVDLVGAEELLAAE